MTDMLKLNDELKTMAMANRNHTKDPLVLVQSHFLARGAGGYKAAQRRFHSMDIDGSKRLSPHEFTQGIRDVGINLSTDEVHALFELFDADRTGTIDFEEFLRSIQPHMNDRRRKLVEAAFAKMDHTGDGVITIEDLTKTYNIKKHPKYMSGQWTKEEVYAEFLKIFESEGHLDGTVTQDEFLSYYSALSSCIENDTYFDLMMRNSWGAELAA